MTFTTDVGNKMEEEEEEINETVMSVSCKDNSAAKFTFEVVPKSIKQQVTLLLRIPLKC